MKQLKNIYGWDLWLNIIRNNVIFQVKKGYINGDKIKHISPKIFFAHETYKKIEINVNQI